MVWEWFRNSMGSTWEGLWDVFGKCRMGSLWEWLWVQDGKHLGLPLDTAGEATGKASQVLKDQHQPYIELAWDLLWLP